MCSSAQPAQATISKKNPAHNPANHTNHANHTNQATGRSIFNPPPFRDLFLFFLVRTAQITQIAQAQNPLFSILHFFSTFFHANWSNRAKIHLEYLSLVLFIILSDSYCRIPSSEKRRNKSCKFRKTTQRHTVSQHVQHHGARLSARLLSS